MTSPPVSAAAAPYAAMLDATDDIPEVVWRWHAVHLLADANPFADEGPGDVTDEMLADYQRCASDWGEE